MGLIHFLQTQLQQQIQYIYTLLAEVQVVRAQEVQIGMVVLEVLAAAEVVILAVFPDQVD
jgi:hypothetical protein